MTSPQGQPVQQLTDARYGENKSFMEQQRVMPAAEAQALSDAPSPEMTASALAPETAPTAPSPGLPPIGGLFDPPSDPNEPVTNGGAFGPGASSLRGDALANTQSRPFTSTLSEYAAADPSGVLSELVNTLYQQGL
jgi:hypothetical protein